MKKNTIIAAIAAASALLLCASCQKQEISELSNGSNAGGKTFTATIENLTKTTLTSIYKVNWETGDKLNINGKEYTATPDASNPTRATLVPTTGEAAGLVNGKYSAIYPASLYGSDKFMLPAIQTYNADHFNAPMYSESNTDSFFFRNICGVLCLSLKGNSTDKVKYVTVVAKNEGVCGAFTMDSDATTLRLSSTVGEYSRTVSLDCSHVGETTTGAADGGVALSSTATNFYIYLPPQTYTAGMKIIITTADHKVFEKTTTVSAIVGRNNIYTFNDWTLDFKSKPALLSGEFTVADNSKKVRFTRGNLYAKKESGNWTLHYFDEQYGILPANRATMGGSQRTMDSSETEIEFFTWSSTVEEAVKITSSGNYLFCNESNKQTVDGQSGCYALSNDEWIYLFDRRTDCHIKCGFATVNGVHGAIILPDTFSDPYAGFKVFKNRSTLYWTANVYSEAEWIAMESERAVFLPTSGAREFDTYTVKFVGDYAYYWSSSEDSTYGVLYARTMHFFNNNFATDSYFYRRSGFNIRLVTNCQ